MKVENNKVELTGVFVSEFRFDHETHGRKFYQADILVERLSGKTDVISVEISSNMLDMRKKYEGNIVSVSGQLRTSNIFDGEKRRLKLKVFARSIQIIDAEDSECDLTKNVITLDGYVCKEPYYRKTTFGRYITDLCIAVNRSYQKSDYIPCIAWWENALEAADYTVGTHVKIEGRIQSREYMKKLSETETENRVAYEVSINTLERVEDDE